MEKLSDEQRARIAQNRAEALRRLEERKKRLATEEVSAKRNNVNLQCTTDQCSMTIIKQNSNFNNGASANLKKTRNPVAPSARDQQTFNTAPLALTQSAFTPIVKVNFLVMNQQRTKILFSPFHIAIVDVIKLLPTRQYNDSEKYWSVCFSDYEKAVIRLRSLKNIRAEVEELPPEIQGKTTLAPPVSFSGIEDDLMNSLFPYQKLGVAFGIQKGGRVLIADEMGLGKSIQALALSRKFCNEWPLLIICPSSVKSAWRTQIEKFLPNCKDIYLIEKNSDVLPRSRSTSIIVIMSYDQMTIRLKELLNHSFYVIIFDESHFLKEIKAKRTKAAVELSKKATRVILLSGTPALSRPIELFSQMKIISPKIFPYYQTFGLRYCDGRQGRFGYEMKGATNTDELVAILEKTVMIRRLKKDVLNDLPAKRREIIYLSGDSINHRMQRLREAHDALIKSNKSANGKDKHDCLMRYYVETGIVKAQSVAEHIIESYFYEGAERQKMLIFAHHSVVLDTITMMVARKGVKYIRIDGGTQQRDRGRLCDEFQTQDDVLVAILSITAAGVGITLTAASTVVFAELHWNPGSMLQAEDRAHRIGQKNSIVVQYMLARKTADDDIWPLIEKKLKILGSVNLSSDSYKDAKNLQRDCSERAISSYFARLTNTDNNDNNNVIIEKEDNQKSSNVPDVLSVNETKYGRLDLLDDEESDEILIDEKLSVGPSAKRIKN